ncbi:hypothetical protein [Ferroplasma acidiphilum]|nr:hypothetical protein [Ferroplasma acidiphilum]
MLYKWNFQAEYKFKCNSPGFVENSEIKQLIPEPFRWLLVPLH